MGNYDRRNVDNRLKTTAKHEARVREEHDKNLTQFPFIEKIDVFFYDGTVDTAHKEYVVQFVLKNPLLFKVFREVINEKLKGATIE